MRPCAQASSHLNDRQKTDSNSIIIRPKRYLKSGVASVACISVSGNHVQSFHYKYGCHGARSLCPSHSFRTTAAAALHCTSKLNQHAVAKIQKIARQHVGRTLRITSLYSRTPIAERCTSESDTCGDNFKDVALAKHVFGCGTF